MLDLKLDISQMIGVNREVEASIQMFYNLLLAKTDLTDLNPVWIEYKLVSREQMKEVYAHCSTGIELCNAKIQGKIGKISLGQIGIIANEIIIR